MNQRLTILALALVLITGTLQGQQTLQLLPSNPHYFLYQKKPTVLIGSGEHYGAVVNSDFDYRKYLAALAGSRLNLTRLFAGAYVEKPGDFGIQKNTLAPSAKALLLPWKRSNVDGYALGGNKFDLDHWDDIYFKRLKDFVGQAAQQGIIVEVNLFSSYYGTAWNYSAFNARNNINGTDSLPYFLANTLMNHGLLKHQERYVRKIVHELNGFDNIYYEVQNEPWADQTDTVVIRNEYGAANDWRNTIQVVAQSSNAWQRKVAEWIRDEERPLSKKHLISQNISNFYYPVKDPDPAIDIFNFHYALPEAVTVNYYLNKVIGCNETGFAGSSDTTYRKQAWRFIMAGGGLFNHLDYSFSVGQEDGTDLNYKAPGGGSPQLRKQLGILKRFIDHCDLSRLEPDRSFVSAVPGAFVEALREKDAAFFVYYEPMLMDSAPLRLHLPAGVYNVTWMDVDNGTVYPAAVVNGATLAVPGRRTDKVAIIRKR